MVVSRVIPSIRDERASDATVKGAGGPREKTPTYEAVLSEPLPGKLRASYRRGPPSSRITAG